jgi:cobalt-precorrin 5A hydrolase
VVIDEAGGYVISLLAGHIGGANQLTKEVAALIRAEPVITTATDINRVPAIDVLAGQRHLAIENPGAIRHVSMAFLKGDRIYLHDPNNLMIDALPDKNVVTDRQTAFVKGLAGVFIDDRTLDLPDQILVLRPKTLAVGIGCNRHTPLAEIRHLLLKTLKENNLSPASVTCLASVDIKADEQGLLALGRSLDCPVLFFTKKELGQVTTIKNPSAMVEKHIGVKSVCEAAAILAAQNGHLTVPKQKTSNVTVAIARKNFTLSA